MSGTLNRVTLIGNLGRDPEVRQTSGGQKVVTLSLATSETWKDKSSGQRKERTDWHNVVIFNEGICGISEQYLHKGSKCCVEGSLQTRKWKDSAGADRYTTEVVIGARRGNLTLMDSPKNEKIEGVPESLNDEIPF